MEPRAESPAAPLDIVASVGATLADTDDLELRPDGRSLRRERNRQRVIEALIELIREGDHDPGAAAIADRAGVSHRSVFRYFDDLADLVNEVVRTEFNHVAEVAALQDVGIGPVEGRIDRLVESRVTAYDIVYEISRVAYRRAVDIPEIDRSLRRIQGLLRRELDLHFQPELAAMSDHDHETVLDLLLATTSFETFGLFRDVLERSDREITERWGSALRRLLGAAT